MKLSLNKIIVFLVYSISLLMIYSIMVYYFKSLPSLPKHEYIKVFFSSPLLLISGLLLFFRFEHKVSGFIFLIIGLFWLGVMFYEIYTKQ
jgi:hypothetical protein